MNNKKTFIILALVFVLLISGAAVLYSRLSADAEAQQLADERADARPEDAVLAPDFAVFNSQWEEVHLSDFVGKPTVLNFWASWCGPCKAEMPGFQEKYLEFGEDINFMMVNMTSGRETSDTAWSFVYKNGYTFPIYYDTTREASTAFSAYSIPTTFFIDADGYIITTAVGTINAETLQQGIDMIS